MSKSLGNFFTVREITDEFDPMVLRLFMLSAHYRNPLNFSRLLMESAGSSLERMRRCRERLEELSAGAAEGEASENVNEAAEAFISRFDEKMDDDFNTSDAVSVVFDLVRYANTELDERSTKGDAAKLLAAMDELCGVLGLELKKQEESIDAQVEALIEERQAARKARDFAKADEIRDKLKGMGIVLTDTKDGVKWSRA